MSKWIWYIIIIIIAILLVIYVFNVKTNEDVEIKYDSSIGGKYQIVSSSISDTKENIEIEFLIATESSDTVNVIVNSLDFKDEDITIREQKLQEMGKHVIELSFVDTKFQDKSNEIINKNEGSVLKKVIYHSPKDNQTSVVYLVCSERVNVEITRNIDKVKVKLFR